MELLLKLTALCLSAAAVSALLARSGEYAMLLMIATVVVTLAILSPAVEEALALGEELLAMTGISTALFVPLLKVMAVALIESLGVSLCKDAGRSSLAVVLQLAGTLCALSCAVPLLRAAMDMLEEWI